MRHICNLQMHHQQSTRAMCPRHDEPAIVTTHHLNITNHVTSLCSVKKSINKLAQACQTIKHNFSALRTQQRLAAAHPAPSLKASMHGENTILISCYQLSATKQENIPRAWAKAVTAAPPAIHSINPTQSSWCAQAIALKPKSRKQALMIVEWQRSN